MGGERDLFDAAKAGIREAWTARPPQLYGLGAAARVSVETDAVAMALGYANARAMLAAELPEIPAETVLHAAQVAAGCSAAEVERFGFEKMYVFTRWVREAGLKRPGGDLGAWMVRTVDEDGQPLGGKPFARCSVEQLERALEAAKKAKPPDGGEKSPAPLPPSRTWPYWPVVGGVLALAAGWWVCGRRGQEAGAPPLVVERWDPPHVEPPRPDGGAVFLQPALRPAHSTIRASPEPEAIKAAPVPMPTPSQKADVGPDLTQEQLDEILRNGGPVTHPVE